MKHNTVICFGDSNTAGFDPRDPLGGEYGQCWCSLLAEATGFTVLNLGENGRMIPRREFEFDQFFRFLPGSREEDTLILLLGTNDILMGRSPETVAADMETLLKRLKKDWPELRVILLSPPPVGIPGYSMDSVAGRYEKLAAELGIEYADTQRWDLPLAFDGVHLSEAGHRRFAEHVTQILNQ